MNFLVKAFLALLIFAVPATMVAGCQSCKRGKRVVAVMMKKNVKAGSSCRSGRCSRKMKGMQSRRFGRSTSPKDRAAKFLAVRRASKGGCSNGSCAIKAQK